MENDSVAVRSVETTVSTVRDQNLRVQLKQLSMHIKDNLAFPVHLFTATREGYIALFDEFLTEHPHPNVNFIYRL
ncbi:hypothetical protein MTO96_050223 [Rhipicephalus appendiculatus]